MSHTRYLVTVLATLSVFTSSGSLAKVVDSSAAGFTIENTVIVPADADTAWIALVNHVDEWWPKDHSWFGKAGKFSIDARAGGCFCEVVDKQQQAMHMTVSMVVAGVKLRMLGGLGPLQGMGVSGAMDWKFDPAEGGTRITLRYVAGGYTSIDLVKFAKVVDEVQGVQLGGLAAYLEKRRAPK